MASRLLQIQGEAYQIGPHEIVCILSIGLDILVEAMTEADDLLRDAGIAMVAAKADGAKLWLYGDRNAIKRSAIGIANR